MEKKEAQKAEGTTFAKELYDIIEILVIAACVVLMLYSFVCRVCIVSGGAMDTTLADRQLLMVSNINYTPDTGDIIVFHQTTNESFGLNEPVVKRVIATAGQTIDIDFDTWTVTITDTDGIKATYEFLDIVFLNELEYVILEPEDGDGYVDIFRVIKTSKGEAYQRITDDRLLDEIFEVFRKKNEDEFDFE